MNHKLKVVISEEVFKMKLKSRNRFYSVSYTGDDLSFTQGGAVWNRERAIPYVGKSGWKEMLAGNEVEGVDGDTYWVDR